MSSGDDGGAVMVSGEGEATLAAVWRDGRGPLHVLPRLLFEDRRALLVILVAWVLAFGGSVLLGLAITTAVPEGAGPDFGQAPGWLLLILIALVAPLVETLVMAAVLEVLRRLFRPWIAAVASSAAWGVAHSLMAPLWGVVIWWPFLIFSTLYLTWRGRGWWRAAGIAAAVHVLQNAAPAVATALGY